MFPSQARAFMVRTGRWKYVRFVKHPPMLFDLEADPGEVSDLGRSAGHAGVCAEMEARLTGWLAARRLSVTMPDAAIEAATGKAKERGYLFGVW